MAEMLHISGQQPYVNTMQDQFLVYANGTLLSVCQMYPETRFVVVSRLCVSVW